MFNSSHLVLLMMAASPLKNEQFLRADQPFFLLSELNWKSLPRRPPFLDEIDLKFSSVENVS
jgi:hypothetical protein